MCAYKGSLRVVPKEVQSSHKQLSAGVELLCVHGLVLPTGLCVLCACVGALCILFVFIVYVVCVVYGRRDRGLGLVCILWK